MSDASLPILNQLEVLARTSESTRRVLERRVHPESYEPFLAQQEMATLRALVATILSQDTVGTDVDLAEAIDRRLSNGTNAGWRYAELPPDPLAYREGLVALATALQGTPMTSFEGMPAAAREAYLGSVARGEVDAVARFPLATFLKMVRADTVRMWMAHPAAMQRIEYYGFADGATGQTNGPTDTEGWSAITPASALPFEKERTA